LKPLIGVGEELVETWKAISEAYGPNVTGRQVREIVRARHEELKTPEERLPERLQEINNLIRRVGVSVDDPSDLA
jgi:hypothetical protein